MDEPQDSNGRGPAPAAGELPRRLVSVGLGFWGAVLVVLLLQTAIEGRDRWLESRQLAELGTRLAKEPANAELTTEIRALDRDLRQAYLRYRERRRLGAWLLLAGAAWILTFRHLAESRRPEPVPPLPPGPDAMQDQQRRARRLGVRSVWLVAGAAAGVLALLGTGLPLRLPAPVERLPAGQATPPAEPASLYGSEAWQQNWPRFRGPWGTGVAAAGDWPLTWDAAAGTGIAWKVALPEPNCPNSPVVWGERLFLTTADRQSEKLHCFATADGRLLWSAEVRAVRREPSKFQDLQVMEDTGFAAATAATDGRQVFVAFATADIAAFDFDGRQLWALNLGLPENSYGLASSLAVYHGMVIWQLDQGFDAAAGKSAMIAFDATSGKILWRTPRQVVNSWSSPALIQTAVGDQLIACANPWVVAYGPKTGAEIWRAEVLGGEVAPSPAAWEGIVYTTNSGAQVAAVRADGQGDVTKTKVLWTALDCLPDTASPVCDGRYVVQAGSEGTVTCSEAATGKLLWEQSFDSGFLASPVLAGGLVYLWGDKGEVYVIEVGSSYVLKSKVEVGEPLRATPAFVAGAIYIRGEKSLFRVGAR